MSTCSINLWNGRLLWTNPLSPWLHGMNGAPIRPHKVRILEWIASLVEFHVDVSSVLTRVKLITGVQTTNIITNDWPAVLSSNCCKCRSSLPYIICLTMQPLAIDFSINIDMETSMIWHTHDITPHTHIIAFRYWQLPTLHQLCATNGCTHTLGTLVQIV